MTTPTDHTDRAIAAILDAADTEQNVVEWLTHVIATASVLSDHAVLRGRGWEQDKVADLVQSAGAFADPDQYRRPDPRTQP